MAKDVTITFAGEMDELRNELQSLHGEIRRWGQGISAIGVAAFGAWAASQAFDFIIGKLQTIAGLVREGFTGALEEQLIDAKQVALLQNLGDAADFTSGELRKMAERMQELTTFSDDAAQSAQNTILQFRNIRGDQFARVTELAADMATALGTDLPAATESLGRALNQPLRGLQLLQRQGIDFTDEQKKLVQTLVESGRQAEAQRILLDRLEGTYRGLAQAAASTASGGLAQLKNQIDSVKEAIGAGLVGDVQGLIPAMQFIVAEAGQLVEQMVKDIRDFVAGAVNPLVDVQDAAEKLVAVFAGLEFQVRKLSLLFAEQVLRQTGGAEAIGGVVFATFSKGRPDFNAAFQHLAKGFERTQLNTSERLLGAVRDGLRNLPRTQEEAETEALQRFRDRNLTAGLEAGFTEGNREIARRQQEREEGLLKEQMQRLQALGSLFSNLTSGVQDAVRPTIDSLRELFKGGFLEPLRALLKAFGVDFGDQVKQVKDDPGFRSQIVGLEELFRRQQAAAASITPDGAEQITVRGMTELEMHAELLKNQIVDAAPKALQLLSQLAQGNQLSVMAGLLQTADLPALSESMREFSAQAINFLTGGSSDPMAEKQLTEQRETKTFTQQVAERLDEALPIWRGVEAGINQIKRGIPAIAGP